MFDYTPEGIKLNQGELALCQLDFINRKLKKINRNLSLILLLGVGLTLVKYKNEIKELKNMKGE